MLHPQKKYRNTGVWVNLRQNRVLGESEIETVKKLRAQKAKSQFHHFPSKHEYKVYNILKAKITREQEIILQYPLQLIKPCCTFPRGKYWKVDFAIFQKSESFGSVVALVEAKGYETADFIYNLLLLEQFVPKLFHELCIVYPTKKPSKGIVHKMNKNPDWRGEVFSLKDFQKSNLKFGGD